MALIFLTATAITLWAVAPSEQQVQLEKRLAMVRPRRIVAPDEEQLAPFSERVLKPARDRVIQAVVRVTPQGWQERARERLLQANRRMPAQVFVAIRVLGGIAGFFLVLVLLGVFHGLYNLRALVFLIVGAFAGWELPDFWLSTQVTKRQNLFRRALPDVVDLISVSMEAGLGFDAAVQKVTEKYSGPVADEFATYLKEARLGRTRVQALQDMIRRMPIEELEMIVTAVIHADQAGIGLSRVFHIQSQQMRIRRRQKAEELAMKAPTKMLFPLIFFIFPTLFIILFGPLALNLMQVFRGQ